MQSGEKAAALFRGKGQIVVGACEMGEDTGEPNVFGRDNFCIKRRRLLVPDSEATHARIDFKMYGDHPSGVATDCVEAGHFLGRRNGGGEVVAGEETIFLGQERAEEKNGPTRSEFAQRRRLGNIGDRKKISSGMHKPCGDLVQPVPVGVGFDHRDVTYRARQGGADELKITLERREIDLGPTAQWEGMIGGAHVLVGAR